MKMRTWVSSHGLACGLALGAVGCAHNAESGTNPEVPGSAQVEVPEASAAASVTSAGATLAPKSGNTTLSGQAKFTQTADGVKLALQVQGLPPGQHGAHIHEKGDCGDPEAKNAGSHWNPAGHQHGAPPPSSVHLGDLGNLTVGADGKGELDLTSADWKIGGGAPQDVIGKAVVIHADVDDLVTDPAGNSGARIGCGVIQ